MRAGRLSNSFHAVSGLSSPPLTGIEGLNAFRTHQPHIVITDILMPEMDGLSMVEEIRKLDVSVPIIITAASELKEQLLRSIDIGVDKYLTKPIDFNRLMKALTSCAQLMHTNVMLRESEEGFRNLFYDHAAVKLITDPYSGAIIMANHAAADFYKWSLEKLSQMNIQDINTFSPEEIKQKMASAVAARRIRFESRHRLADGAIRDVEIFSSVIKMERRKYIHSIISDITERKQAERYQRLSGVVVDILSESLDFQESVRRILIAMKHTTGFDAVGMRLESEDDFPYCVQNGFSSDFLLTENTLAARKPNGDIFRKPNGKTRLECFCGQVISGKTDPSNPVFTMGGSFWTNDSNSLLGLPADGGRRINPRNRCIHDGYASFALIPIKTKDKIIGLLQFNNRRKGCFTLDVIHALESIAIHIGEAFMRKSADEKIRREAAVNKTLAEIASTLTLSGFSVSGVSPL